MDPTKQYVSTRSLSSFLSDAGEVSSLKTLDIELTERCNYNCIHCCINQPRTSPLSEKELSSRRLREILIEAATLNVRIVRLTGGEPLLRPDFADIYSFARQLGLDVLLFTNGSLLTPELVELLAARPANKKLEITCYGMSRESYESVTRTPGSFRLFRQGVELLVQAKIPFVIKGAILPENAHEVDAFDAWNSTLPWGNGRTSFALFFDLRLRRDSEKKNDRIREKRIAPVRGLAIISRGGRDFIDDQRTYCSEFMFPQGDRLFVCGAGKSTVSLDAYGWLHPCQLVKDPGTAYDLGGGSLKKALSEFFPAIRRRRAEHPEYLRRCADCFLKGLCEMCPGKSWTEHGTLDTPVEYCCSVAHAQAVYLGYLREGEKGWEVQDGKERLKRPGDV